MLSLGRTGRAHMDLIYPWTVVLGRRLGHYAREPPGQEYWGVARVPLAAASCLLSPISLVFLLHALHSWSGAQREKQGHHSGCWDRPCSASTYMEESGISERHQDVLGATCRHGCQRRRQDLGAVLRILQTKHRRGSNRMLHPQHTVQPAASTAEPAALLSDEKTEAEAECFI